MPKAVEINSTVDMVGRKLQRDTKVAFTVYMDSGIYIGTIEKITAGTINPQVYLKFSRTWKDYQGNYHTGIFRIRRSARNVVRIVEK